ncbi:hypothetical protein GGX14DRAFT_660251 [Mycena pura]|uniref:F-box domain-containing protein n=1 Tax=Mycena pura TaxID=153505 RepID=A0AAD6Y442_9AGAR|nr:hypothetical protein GGX14DRAFT_660251 [Mycena pura]
MRVQNTFTNELWLEIFKNLPQDSLLQASLTAHMHSICHLARPELITSPRLLRWCGPRRDFALGPDSSVCWQRPKAESEFAAAPSRPDLLIISGSAQPPVIDFAAAYDRKVSSFSSELISHLEELDISTTIDILNLALDDLNSEKLERILQYFPHLKELKRELFIGFEAFKAPTFFTALPRFLTTYYQIALFPNFEPAAMRRVLVEACPGLTSLWLDGQDFLLRWRAHADGPAEEDYARIYCDQKCIADCEAGSCLVQDIMLKRLREYDAVHRLFMVSD